MDTSPKIVCIGEALVEFVGHKGPESKAIYHQGFGGDTSNTAIAAARQGCSSGYISGVGNDPFGQALMQLWQREGVDTSHVAKHPNASTGIYFIDPDPKHRRFTYYRSGSAASLVVPEYLPNKYISNAEILHASGISLAISHSARQTVFAAIEIARSNGTRVSIDTNLRLQLWSLEEARNTIHQAMALADIALPSYDDATELTQLSDKYEIVDFYHRLGVRIVALKLGENGCIISWDGQRTEVPPFKIKPVDATGAGDTFAGTFLAHLVRTNDPHQAALYANAAAALAVSGYGAVAPIPDYDSVISFMECPK